MVGQQRDNGSIRPFDVSGLRRGLREVEGRAIDRRRNNRVPASSREAWVVPEQRQNRVEEQINYGGDFEASGHPPDYGLPPPQTRKRSIDPRIPNRSSNQGPISNVRGSTNRGPVRRDTLPLDDPTYDEAIHGLGGRPAADPFRNIGMGGDFLADIPHGSELFRPRPQPQPNRVVKRSGRVGDRRRAEEPERQFGGRRSISAGFVRRAGDQPMAPRRKAPALPPRFERALWKRFREGFPEPVIRFYLEQLTQNDDPTPLGSNFLGEILKDEAISFHEGQPRQTWTAKKTLGSGAFGDVVLWERQRGIGQPIDQLAVKNASFDSWFEDYSSEAHLTRRVNLAGCKNVINVYDWAPLDRQSHVRIIYEFYPLGDLSRPLDFYSKNGLVFPESFLWHVFHNLATAICYCARGTTDAAPRPRWEEIVHCDIKPNNVLMDWPDAEVNRFYPNLKLADFGLAYTIPNEEIRNFKRQHGGGGAIGYMAPEMDDPEIIGPVAYRFPGTHSDVYTLGVVIREFAQLATSRYPASAEALLERGLREGWGWEYYPYSEELMTLIQDCTQLDGRNRPPIYDVYRRTKEWSEFMAQRLEAMDQQAQAEYSDRYFTRATVLWTRAQQEEYRHSESFRDAYFRATDWFYLNQGKYEDLCEVAVNPRPAPLGYMAIGNGLKFERIQPPPIARRVQRVRGEDPRETQPTKSAYNQGFRESIDLGGTAIQGGRKGRGLTGRVVRSIFKMFKRRER